MKQNTDLTGASALEKLIANSAERLSYAQLHRFLQSQAQKEGVPLHGSLELTPLCNLDCKMCYVHLSKQQMGKKTLLDVSQWKRLISEAAETGMMDVTLTGGECLSYPGFDEVYLHLQELGIQISVLTNGILLTEERVRFFKEHPVSHIQVTLYGSSEEEYEAVTGHRSFALVTENIQRAKEASLPLTVAITPNRFLPDGGEALLRFVDMLGLPYTINASLFSPRVETGRQQDDIDLSIDSYVQLYTLERQLKKQPLYIAQECNMPAPSKETKEAKQGLRCSAGSSSFSVGWDGVLTPCSSLYTISVRLLEVGFASAWETIRRAAIAYPIPAECEHCEYNYLCPGCVMVHAVDTPQGHASPRMCVRAKALIAAGLAPSPDMVHKQEVSE